MNKSILRAIAVGVLLLSSAFAADKVTSEYTSSARKNALSYKTYDTDGFTQVCPGLGGYQPVLSGGDDRSWINVRYGGTVVDLYGTTMSHAGGEFPTKANDVVEWRGVHTTKGFRPYAIIYRINSTSPGTRRQISRLLVIKLDGANSRIVGHTQGKTEDADAKALADANR